MTNRISPSQVGFVNAREILQDAAGISGPDLPSSIHRASHCAGWHGPHDGRARLARLPTRRGSGRRGPGDGAGHKDGRYVGIAPLVGGFTGRLPRRAFLVAMDALRASVALALPFVDQIWQIYVLMFVLQSASAAFTPTFQATIPDILPDERDYTRALSLSRLAYDLENLLSPTLGAALLTVISFHSLFGGTVVGFIVSALLILTVRLPQAATSQRQQTFFEKATRGLRIYLATPRLRGLLALNLSVAAAGAIRYDAFSLPSGIELLRPGHPDDPERRSCTS